LRRVGVARAVHRTTRWYLGGCGNASGRAPHIFKVFSIMHLGVFYMENAPTLISIDSCSVASRRALTAIGLDIL
jgi:hypothetical protein